MVYNFFTLIIIIIHYLIHFIIIFAGGPPQPAVHSSLPLRLLLRQRRHELVHRDVGRLVRRVVFVVVERLKAGFVGVDAFDVDTRLWVGNSRCSHYRRHCCTSGNCL